MVLEGAVVPEHLSVKCEVAFYRLLQECINFEKREVPVKNYAL